MNYAYLVLLLFILYLLGQFLFTGYFYIKGVNLSKIVYTGNHEFGNKSKEIKLSVVGDSVAAGVGASSLETSVAGRIAKHMAKKNHVILNNSAVSGSKVKDLLNTSPKNQDLTVMIISSNDLFHFTNLKQFEIDARKVIEKYQKNTKKLIILGPLRVDTATSIPLFLRPVYYYMGFKYLKILEDIAKKYANVHHTSSYYLKSTAKYGKIEGSDRFHPNNSGHTLYADMIIKEIE